MIVDLDAGEFAFGRCDVVVLGAGAVGLSIAVKLARSGKKVLVCESGGARAELAAQALNEALVVGRKHEGITIGRARVLGGTTTLWGGQLVPFREIDFQARPWLARPAWPIDAATIAPYYCETAEMLGLPPLQEDEAVWRSIKLSPPDLGPDLEVVLTRWLRETNLAHIFAQDIASSKNLVVLLHATAVDLEIVGSDIKAVRLRSPRGKEIRAEAKSYVNACGTIEACRLMLNAARLNPNAPWAGNSWLGKGFQDHLDLQVATIEPIDARSFNNVFDNIFVSGYKYNPKVALAPHVQASEELTNVAAVVVFSSSLNAHLSNLKIMFRSLRSGKLPSNAAELFSLGFATAKLWWPLIARYLRDHRAFNPSDLGIGLRLHCEQAPLRESAIQLEERRLDANGVPLVRLNWRVDGREMRAMAALTKRLGAALRERNLARLKVDPRLDEGDTSILDDAVDTNHQCGGLQMGYSSEDGVTDSTLRVHGTTNLYVAGASVFPSSSFANPTFTAIALGLRLADHLAVRP